jgi:hypothetical protein
VKGRAVCGGSGADCSFSGNYEPSSTHPNHAACISSASLLLFSPRSALATSHSVFSPSILFLTRPSPQTTATPPPSPALPATLLHPVVPNPPSSAPTTCPNLFSNALNVFLLPSASSGSPKPPPPAVSASPFPAVLPARSASPSAPSPLEAGRSTLPVLTRRRASRTAVGVRVSELGSGGRVRRRRRASTALGSRGSRRQLALMRSVESCSSLPFLSLPFEQ